MESTFPHELAVAAPRIAEQSALFDDTRRRNRRWLVSPAAVGAFAGLVLSFKDHSIGPLLVLPILMMLLLGLPLYLFVRSQTRIARDLYQTGVLGRATVRDCAQSYGRRVLLVSFESPAGTTLRAAGPVYSGEVVDPGTVIPIFFDARASKFAAAVVDGRLEVLQVRR